LILILLFALSKKDKKEKKKEKYNSNFQEITSNKGFFIIFSCFKVKLFNPKKFEKTRQKCCSPRKNQNHPLFLRKLNILNSKRENNCQIPLFHTLIFALKYFKIFLFQ
jgi:hypothetical protein